MPSECDIPIHTFSNFTKVSRFVSSLDHQYLSIIAYLQYLQFCDNLDRLPKKVAQPTATALHRPPSNLQWTQIRDFQTRTRTWNPGLTFPKPENPGLQKQPGFGNSNINSSIKHEIRITHIHIISLHKIEF